MSTKIEITVPSINEILDQENKSFENIAEEYYEYFHTFCPEDKQADILITMIGHNLELDFTFFRRCNSEN